MAKQSVQFKTRGFNFAGVAFVNATGTTTTTIIAAGANDSIVKSILITSDDTSARAVKLIIYDGSAEHIIDTIAVPTLSGVDGSVAAVDALTNAGLPLDAQNKKVIPLKAGCTLKAAMVGAVTSAKTVTVSAILEDY